MKFLHVLRTIGDRLPVELARSQEGHHEVSLLLVQDGVWASHALGSNLRAYALRADLEARGLPAGPSTVDYDDAIRLMAEHDRVVVW